MADEDKDKKPVTVQKLEPQPVAPSSVSVQANAAQKPYDGMPAMARPKDNPTLIPVNVASKPALKPDEDPGVKSLGNQIKMLHEMANRYVPEDDATRRRRERAENARRITANVGDGLAALANLVGATKGAPVVQNATMASKVEQRLAELRQEREANEQKFMNYSLKENELINQRAATVRQLEADKAAKDKQAKEDKWTEKERAQKERLWESEFQEALAKATAAEFTAVYKQLQAEYAGKLSQAKIDEIASRIYKNMHAGSGRSGKVEQSWTKDSEIFRDADGNIVGRRETKEYAKPGEPAPAPGKGQGGKRNDAQNQGQNGDQQQSQQKPGLTGNGKAGKNSAKSALAVKK